MEVRLVRLALPVHMQRDNADNRVRRMLRPMRPVTPATFFRGRFVHSTDERAECALCRPSTFCVKVFARGKRTEWNGAGHGFSVSK
jgi:hypothetical protein